MKLLIDLQGAQGVSHLRGIGRYSRELAYALAAGARGHEVHLLFNGALRDGGDAVWDEVADPLHPAARHTWWGVEGTTGEATGPEQDVRRVAGEVLRAEAIEAIAPDVLLVASLFEGAGEAVVPHWPRDRPRPPTAAICYDLIPLLFRDDYLDGIWALSGRMREWYFRCLHELAACDLLLAISECSRQDAIDQLALDEDRVVNVRAGKSPLFRPETLDDAARQALRDRYGLRDGFIVFVGAGDPRKNEARLLQAYGLLPRDLRARHQLVVVGATDPQEFSAALRAAGLGAEEARLIRFVEEADLPRLYAMATLAVLPSLYEGFGLPALEAMACGTPSIGSRTGSLPEVIGLPQALFDPHDPADIARAMQAALTDVALYARLRAHAPEQAARFGWDRTAALAWDALERLDARNRNGGGRPWRRQRLKRLAVVSPLSPERTGIADYTAELAPALARHYDVTLVNRVGGTDHERLRGVFRTMSASRFAQQADGFDRILYQLGNSDYHDFQLDGLMAGAPGVVTLHDAFLSGHALWAGTRHDAAAPGFAEALHDSHGWPAVVQLAREGESAALSAWPCSLPVLRDTLGLIQHSELAASVLRQHFGPAASGPAFVIPHLRQLPPPADRAAARARLGLDPDAKVVATFGVIIASKLPERLIAAWDRLNPPAGANARLAFVGEMAESLPLPMHDPRFVFVGRASRAIYADWLAAADVAVQLRAASRGETSGAVADCLAAGLPLIANSHGTVTEIPEDCLRLLPEHFTDAELGEAISGLLVDPEAARALGGRGRQWVRETLAPAAIARAYRDAIEQIYADPDAFRRIGDPFRGSHLPAGGADDWAAVSRATIATCPTRRPPFLFLDVTEDWPDRAPATALLGGHPHDVRVELVQLDASTKSTPALYRTAPVRAAEWLDIPAQRIAAQQVSVRRDDVLVLPEGADLTARETALREMRLRGVRLAEMGRDGVIRMRDGVGMPDWLAAWQAPDNRPT